MQSDARKMRKETRTLKPSSDLWPFLLTSCVLIPSLDSGISLRWDSGRRLHQRVASGPPRDGALAKNRQRPWVSLIVLLLSSGTGHSVKKFFKNSLDKG